MNRILLIDDDENLGPPLAAYFQRFELQLVHATRPSAGLGPCCGAVALTRRSWT